MEAAERRVVAATSFFLERVDRGSLRWIEWSMHQCSASCCSSSSPTLEEVARCVARCERPALRAQTRVQGVLEGVQEGRRRCLRACEEERRGGLGRKEVEACTVACCDKSVMEFDQLLGKVQEELSSNKYSP